MSEFSTLNGYKVKDKKAIRFYDNVESMKSDTTLKEGMHVKTKGYYQSNDGGHAEYVIKTSSNSYYEILTNELVAELITDNIIDIKKFGAKCDGITDDTISIKNAISYLTENNTTLLIPGVTVVSDTLNFNTSGITIKGYNIKSCGIKLVGSTAYINFGNGSTTVYESQIRDLFIRGDFTQDQLLKFNRCFNIYLNRVYLNETSENNYLIKFINSGIIYINECILDSSEDVENYPAYSNGIFISPNDTIFDMKGCNCWNLNELIHGEGTFLVTNICNNWIENCKKVFYHTNTQSLAYMNLNIENNHITSHNYESFVADEPSFIEINETSTTDCYNTFIKIKNNELYFWDLTKLYNNSLVNIVDVLPSGTIYLIYEGNVWSGKNPNQISSYILKLSDTLANAVKIVSFITNSRLESVWATNKIQALQCSIRNETSIPELCYPNGITLCKSDVTNNGRIYYDTSTNNFYGYYNGTQRMLPKRYTDQIIPYPATSENYLDVINTISTVINNSGLGIRQS